ncbi:MAG: hypothetical protein K6F85_01255 [Bacteroidales bacterium]|nr:hypothetical protein [Bacteroidales bacterium]
MKEKTDKLVTLVCLGLAVLATVFAVVFALDIDNNAFFYGITYWMLLLLLGVSIVAIVVFLCKKLADRFKTQPGYLKKFLLLIGLVVVVLVVSYLLATGNDVNSALLEKNNLTEGSSKLIGAACIVVYILVIGAACSILYVECSKLFKKK